MFYDLDTFAFHYLVLICLHGYDILVWHICFPFVGLASFAPGYSPPAQ